MLTAKVRSASLEMALGQPVYQNLSEFIKSLVLSWRQKLNFFRSIGQIGLKIELRATEFSMQIPLSIVHPLEK